MAKIQYGLNEGILKDMVIAGKARINIKIKYADINKEPQKEEDFEIEM